LEKTKVFFKFRIIAGSLPYKPRNLGIQISHGCRRIGDTGNWVKGDSGQHQNADKSDNADTTV